MQWQGWVLVACSFFGVTVPLFAQGVELLGVGTEAGTGATVENSVPAASRVSAADLDRILAQIREKGQEARRIVGSGVRSPNAKDTERWQVLTESASELSREYFALLERYARETLPQADFKQQVESALEPLNVVLNAIGVTERTAIKGLLDEASTLAVTTAHTGTLSSVRNLVGHARIALSAPPGELKELLKSSSFRTAAELLPSPLIQALNNRLSREILDLHVQYKFQSVIFPDAFDAVRVAQPTGRVTAGADQLERDFNLLVKLKNDVRTLLGVKTGAAEVAVDRNSQQFRDFERLKERFEMVQRSYLTGLKSYCDGQAQHARYDFQVRVHAAWQQTATGINGLVPVYSKKYAVLKGEMAKIQIRLLTRDNVEIRYLDEKMASAGRNVKAPRPLALDSDKLETLLPDGVLYAVNAEIERLAQECRRQRKEQERWEALQRRASR